MKIYHISNGDQQAERNTVNSGIAGLKKAAGCEYLSRFTFEDLAVKTEEEKLKELALMHIHDFNPELTGLNDDHEFKEAWKRLLMNELALRIVHVPVRGKIYGKAADSTVENMLIRRNK